MRLSVLGTLGRWSSSPGPPSVPNPLPLPKTPPHPNLLSASGLSPKPGQDAVLRSFLQPPLPEGRAELLETCRERGREREATETLGTPSESPALWNSLGFLMGGLASAGSLLSSWVLLDRWGAEFKNLLPARLGAPRGRDLCLFLIVSQSHPRKPGIE